MKLVIFIVFLCIINCMCKPYSGKGANICGYEACPKLDPNALNVHIIPHSHEDVGWLKNVDQYFFDDVESILSSVITALRQNPERRFIQVETAFLKKWWEKQTEEKKQQTIDLISNGQLEIVNGAWSMNDEAAVNYQSIIDQFTLGLRYVEDRLGNCSRPRIGWQIDTFGHSREQASIFARMGFDGVFFARLDYRDRDNRLKTKTMEHIWQGSQQLEDTDLFTGVLYNHYSAPSGYSWDHGSNDEPIIEDVESFDYNYPERVKNFANFVREQSDYYISNNIMILMGDDFNYRAALEYYLNMDKLIEGFSLFPQTDNQNRSIRLIYSTPSCYTKAVNEYVLNNKIQLKRKTDDFLPHAHLPHSYWSGFFTSRPIGKRIERLGNNLLQISKQLATVTKNTISHEGVNTLAEAIGIMQHHDAITGTELQHVNDDYIRIISAGNKKSQTFADTAVTTLLGYKGDETLELHTCYLANVSNCEQSKTKDQFYIILYNPLAQSVNHYVSVPIVGDTWNVIDPEGKIVESNVFEQIRDFGEKQNNVLMFNAQIPALGISVYTVVKNTKKFNKKQEVMEVDSDDPIGYMDTNIMIDSKTGLLKSITMHGTTLNVKQEFWYYKAQDQGEMSNPWIFTPQGDITKLANGTISTTVTKGTLVTEVKQVFNEWATQIIRIFSEEPDYIEFDWVVGPIDISDEMGKEVVTRYSTSLKSNSKFYVDSNGRESLERIRNFRTDFEYTNEEPASGNYYPVASSIGLKDSNLDVEFVVLTDRAEGGTSLNDGELELMLNRRLIHDELNETDSNGIGILVRGVHYVTLGKKNLGDKSLAAVRRKIALRKLNAPWQFISDQNVDKIISNKQISLLSKELPQNVHLLTVELLSIDDKDETGKLLIRLEHIMEKNDDTTLSKDVTVDIQDLFKSFTINEVIETYLAGDRLKSEYTRLNWDVTEKNKEIKHEEVKATSINLSAMQIRTFIASITFNN